MKPRRLHLPNSQNSPWSQKRQAPLVRRPRGFSLIEVMVVITIIGILVGMAVPSYERAIEQSRADIAGGNLRAIWTAQRLYWLEEHVFCDDLALLRAAGLLNPEIISTASGYSFEITMADEDEFQATASRTGSSRWTGDFTIDESGEISGAIQATGETQIVAGFQ